MTIDFLVPKFKLYNFNDKENGKLAKLMFKVANVPYEDININREEHLDAIKSETPLGTLPILEVDGVKLSGQTAVCRHLAWRFGLSGETAVSDSLLDMFADLLLEAQVLLFGSTDGDNDSIANFVTDDTELEKVCNRVAAIIDKQLTDNNTSYLVGEKITWVDLMTYTFFNSLADRGKNTYLDRYPSTKQMYDRISQLVTN